MWSPEPRSEKAAAIYRSAEKDFAVNPDRYDLSPDQVAKAVRDKFADIVDGEDWLAGLNAYLNSAREEGRLNAFGRRGMLASAKSRLFSRFEGERLLRKRPDIRERKIDRPIFVTGGWRTGTTLLQRLLAAVPSLRGAFPSELSAPARFFDLGEADRKALIDAGGAAHELLHVLSPALATIHPSGAWMEEECVLAMGTDMRNWGLTSTLRCPGYASWLLDQDMTPSYRRYGDVLRMLQWEDGRRWVLKAPAHTAALGSLLTVFPDAYVVHLHRDVVQTVTSGASLFATFRAIYSDQVDPVDVGRYQMEMTALWFERAMAARKDFPDAQIVELPFEELVADPLATARRICALADANWGGDATERAQSRLDELNEPRGKHRYAPEDFGLDRDEVKSRFRAYCTAYGLD